MLDDYSSQCNCHGRIDCSPKVICKLDFRILEENLLLELCLKSYFLNLDHKMYKIYNVPDVI